MRPKKRKIIYYRIAFLIFILTILMAGVYKISYTFLPIIMDRITKDNDIHIQEHISSNSSMDELNSPYAILVSLNDNGQKIIYKTRSNEKVYPASLTKIMTTIVAIENITNFQEMINIPEEIFTDLYMANASMAGFLPGEEVTAMDLLYGTLLPSGAEAAIGLANQVSGSESEFVKLMNKKGKELGMEDTHFMNVTGLHDDNHYSTVEDMAVLLEYALKNRTFRKIFTTERYYTNSTNLHPGGITFYSTLSKNIDSFEFDGGKIIGGKTGYTDEAGLCLASLAEKNGFEYILVTAGAKGNQFTEQFHVIDAFTVFEKYLKKHEIN